MFQTDPGEDRWKFGFKDAVLFSFEFLKPYGLTPVDTPYIPGKNQMTGGTYDGNGNELKPFQGDTAAYDAEGRVVTVSSSSAVVASYHDGDGRRVSKTTPSGVASYLYDAGGALSAEYRNNALSKEYIRFHSEFIPPTSIWWPAVPPQTRNFENPARGSPKRGTRL